MPTNAADTLLSTGTSTPVYDLHIEMWGQSNMVGQADFNATGIATASASDSGMKYGLAFPTTRYNQQTATGPVTNANNPQTYNINTGSVDLQPYAAAGASNMGPEVAIGRGIVDFGLALNPFVGKFAISSTSIPGHWAKVPGFPNSPNTTIYNQYVAYLNARVAETGRDIDAFVQLIGETDSGTPARITSAVSDLTTFYNNIKADVPGAANAKIVIIKINPFSTVGSSDPVSYRAQQDIFAASYPNVFVVDPFDVKLSSDPHYGPAGIGAVGNRTVVRLRDALFPSKDLSLAAKGSTPFYQGDENWFTAEASPSAATPMDYAEPKPNDLQIMVAGSYSSIVTHSLDVAAGFQTLIAQFDSAFSGTVHRGMSVYWRLVTKTVLDANNGRMPIPSLTFGTATLNHAKIFTFRNVDPNNPFGLITTGVNNASTTTLTIPGGTHNNAGSLAFIPVLLNGATQSIASVTNASMNNIVIRRDGRGNPGAGQIGYGAITATLVGNTASSTTVSFSAANVSPGTMIVLNPDSTANEVVTNADDVVSGTAIFGLAGVSGTGAPSDADDSVVGTGGVLLVGSSSLLDADDTATGSVFDLITGTGAVTNAPDTAFGTTAPVISGSGALTDTDDAVSGTGVLGIPGTGGATNAADTVSAAGALTITGVGTVVNQGDTFSNTTATIFGFSDSQNADDTAESEAQSSSLLDPHPAFSQSGYLTFLMKQGDLDPGVSVQVTASDGSAVDLSDAIAVSFRMMSTLTHIQAAAGTASIQGSRLRYAWQPGDTDVAGVFYAEFTITWSDGRPQTFPTRGYLVVTIEPQIV